MESLKKHLPVNSGNETDASKSKFYLELNQLSYMSHVVNGYESVVEYIDAWKKFDGAGAHFVDSLTNAVKGTCYESLGRETTNAFKSVHSSSNGIDPAGKLREVENLLLCLKNQLQNVDENDRCQSNLQIICRCFLLFLKVQMDYHHMCSATIASLLGILVKSYECSDNRDILIQMDNLDLIHVPSSPQQPPSRSKNKGSYSPKLPTKQNTLKSSFLSLFERKSSAEENSRSGSSFYVDLKNLGPDSSGQHLNIKTEDAQMIDAKEDNKTGILVQIGPDPSEQTSSVNSVCYSDPNAMSHNVNKTPLASAEEIDNVINLLSACGPPSKHMATIHENQLSVPIIYTSRTPSPGSDDLRPGNVQRHSEGSLDFSNIGSRNTWPHRSSLPSVALSGHTNYQEGISNQGTLPRRFSHEINRPYYPTNTSGWAYPDSKYGNRTWPMNSMTSHCSDMMNSSWSAIQDSDDLSDDSSCGEQFFAVGLDLVHAMDSKNGSSDEENDKQIEPWGTDDRMRENKPSAAWLSSTQAATDQTRNHRPLSMQWSDPLANRNMWPSAAGSQHVSSFGNLK